jgi:hypothetical protein
MNKRLHFGGIKLIKAILIDSVPVSQKTPHRRPSILLRKIVVLYSNNHIKFLIILMLKQVEHAEPLCCNRFTQNNLLRNLFWVLIL